MCLSARHHKNHKNADAANYDDGISPAIANHGAICFVLPRTKMVPQFVS